MLSLVIPVFNEKDNIGELVRRIEGTLSERDYEIIFVDDSTDNTPQVIAIEAQKNPRIKLIHREGKNGLASAVLDGFKQAEGNVLAVMDGDLQHPPELLLTMLNGIDQGADLVIPSRFIKGGHDGGLNSFRKLVSATARYMGKVLFKGLRRVSDHTGGMFMLKKEVISGVSLKPVGWKILMEILVLGQYKTMLEIPYTFDARNLGQSKLSFKVQLEYLWHLLSLLKRSEQDRRFYVFCLVGFSGVLVDMMIFTLLSKHYSALSVNGRAVISSLCAMTSNYILNNFFTWRDYAPAPLNYKVFVTNLRRFSKHLLVSFSGIVIKSVILFLLYSGLGMNKYLGNLIAIACASFSNYFLSKSWVWRKVKSRPTLYHQSDNMKM